MDISTTRPNRPSGPIWSKYIFFSLRVCLVTFPAKISEVELLSVTQQTLYTPHLKNQPGQLFKSKKILLNLIKVCGYEHRYNSKLPLH